MILISDRENSIEIVVDLLTYAGVNKMITRDFTH